jgi:MoaA/NifB/PqqE/SkfB family radical SAM enzyme
MAETNELNTNKSELHSCKKCAGCDKKTVNNESQITLESIFLKGISFQRKGIIKKLLKLRSVYKHAVLSSFRRKKCQKKKGLLAPVAIAMSPTMRCNLSCIGCYAHDYPCDNELSLDTIDEILGSAEKMGVFLFVITGGEPLMKDGILDVFKRHRNLLFLMVTNGTLMDEDVAKEIANAGNIIPVVSIEGTCEQTDSRRGQGIYDQVKLAMQYLQNERITFGFSSTVTSLNFDTLVSNQFIQEMIDRGCVLGFYTEYIPIGSSAEWSLVLEEKERAYFREKLLEIRRSKPIMVAHMPDDEYDVDGRCQGVVFGSVHINSQGYVEPCPFTHFASDNVRDNGLESALRSRFLAEIRSSEAIYRHGNLGCSLFENKEILEEIAERTGAIPTDSPVFDKIN